LDWLEYPLEGDPRGHRSSSLPPRDVSSRWGNSGSRAPPESLVTLGSPAGSKVINMPPATSPPLLAGRRGTQGSSGREVGSCRAGSRESPDGVARESERRGGIGGRRALRKEMVIGPRREETLPSEQSELPSESRRPLETEAVSWGRPDDQPGKLVLWVEEEEVVAGGRWWWFSRGPEATGLSQPEREEEEEEEEVQRGNRGEQGWLLPPVWRGWRSPWKTWRGRKRETHTQRHRETKIVRTK